MRAVAIGGAATLVVAGLWTRLFAVLWHLDEFPKGETAAAARDDGPEL